MEMDKLSLQGENTASSLTLSHAKYCDSEDPLKHLRTEFIIPTKSDLKCKTLAESSQQHDAASDLSIYLCGNSLGLQPRRTSKRIASHLSAWARKGVLGHFTGHEDTELPPFLHVDAVAAQKMAPLVGALKEEVAVMETLTANLHFLMSSFYKPNKAKYKIIMEGKAFPSDRFAVESHIQHHDLDPQDAIVLVEPPNSSLATITTSQVLATIDEHASSTALILLPGIQYYTGQCFDIKTITAHANAKGILIGWDLAHATGNVDLHLHDWKVDFAGWCNYKYVNSGPGAIAGLFVHERHGRVDFEAIEQGNYGYRPRLSGWWGGDKVSRFAMDNRFVPMPGAAGYQVGNPSALALTAVIASLEIFAMTSMEAIRKKSIALTGFLEKLLLEPSNDESGNPYEIITPSNPEERGAQLSVRLEPGMLEGVMAALEAAGAVVDERKPDVIRVAPAPLYNTYTDVWNFVKIFKEACVAVRREQSISGQAKSTKGSAMVDGGKDQQGWSLVK